MKEIEYKIPHDIYKQHDGKVIEAQDKFKHVMAIALNPLSDYKDGVIRCITSREGDVEVSGYIDRSELYKIKAVSQDKFIITEKLILKNEDVIEKHFAKKGWELIGLEDPDIFIDDTSGLMHLYFTVPYIRKDRKLSSVSLGHAVGTDIDSLSMTLPILPAEKKTNATAKEVAISPKNKRGIRYNLVESSSTVNKVGYSTVRIAIAESMGETWKFGKVAFHPYDHNIPWIAGHASPGPFLPKTFIDPGESKIVGIINGREANTILRNKAVKYGMFSVGLYIYDYEKGIIDWVSKEPFLIDSEAKTITFASQFVETSNGEGILYAHVDDSFVRAYTLYAHKIKTLLPL